MTKPYIEDVKYFLEDYKQGRSTEDETTKKINDKLKITLDTLSKEPGMCKRTLNRALEVLS